VKKWLTVIGLAAALIFGYFLNDRWRPGPETLMNQAHAAFNRNDYRSAQTLFARVIRATPGHSGLRNEASLFHAVCSIRLNRPAPAAAELRQFLAEYPSSFWSPEANFNLAECENDLGHKEAAARIYRRIIAVFPTTSWAEYSQDKLKR